ncbi:MAG: hypothetical protein AAGC57_13695 [Pseudomonadota bacterium]
MTLAEGLPLGGSDRGLFGAVRGLGGWLRLGLAVLLALHPLGAVLVLGWMLRLMRDEAAISRARLASGAGPRRAPLPRWIAGPTGARRWLARRLGGLWETLRWGLASLLTLAASTLPFTLLWLLSWWGGWENSFNKGYEQSWVGPTVALVGVAVALPLMIRLPMALAHQASKGRMSAFFARAAVARRIRAAGWRYVGLIALTVLAALPLFVLQGAPVFVEAWSPGFIERNPDEVNAFISAYRLGATAYLVLVLLRLRRAAARLHARAELRLESGPLPGPLARLGGLLRTLLCLALVFGLVAQVFVAQFVNHQWAVWLLPPLQGLPFFAPLTPVP